MRFKEAVEGWTRQRLTQEASASMLGVCARTFRRYVDRFDEAGMEGLRDQWLSQVSHRRAPVDEVMRLVDRYQRFHSGWNVRHVHAWCRRNGGLRSDTWVKKQLQTAEGGRPGPPTAAPTSGCRARCGT